MEKQTFILKKSGDKLSATEWNNLTSYVNEIVDEVTNDSHDDLDEDLVKSTLHPSANEERNILDLYLNSYVTFDLTYTAGLQNPVTQELINTFRSQNNYILIDSFDISYLELSVIQGLMNERSVITPADIVNLANTTMYERQSGLTSLANLSGELVDLPNERFFKLICSDGILLGLKIAGDIIFNGTNSGANKLSQILTVTSHFLPTILENPNIPWAALPGIVSKLKSFTIPRAYYVITKNSPTYVNIYGRELDNPAGAEVEAGGSLGSGGHVVSGNPTPTPTQLSYTKYLVTDNIGANSIGPGGISTYIYSTDLERFFNISVVDGNYGSIGQSLLDFLYNLLSSEYTVFRYNSTDYVIIPSSDTIDDIVIIAPKYAGQIGKQPDEVKLSDLVTIVNLMKNQTGPWAV